MIQRGVNFPQMGSAITSISGTGICVRGVDLDTDVILESDHMKKVVFDGLEEFAFGPMREAFANKGEVHPFDDERFASATILFANRGFGQGSSREHAPQSLMRWNIRAIVAESYGTEIFFANCIAVGLPALTLSGSEIAEIMESIEDDPQLGITVDVATATVTVGTKSFKASIPKGVQQALLSGSWDAAGEMLKAEDATRRVRDALPYRIIRDKAIHAGNASM